MKCFMSILLLTVSVSTYSQKFVAEKSNVSFFSQAAIEDITASNTQSSSLLDLSTGDIVFIIPIADFEFAKALMKQHFNEKYMETEKFPKATFGGKLSGFDPKVGGPQKAVARGKMTIHGVTQEVELAGTLSSANEKLSLRSKFIIKLADYHIAIPTLMFKHIAEQVEVTVEFTYKPQ